MTTSDLRLLLDYNYWARDRMLHAAAGLTPEQFTRDLGSSFPSVRDTLAHLYFAEWIWYSRWRGTSPTEGPGLQVPDVPSLEAVWRPLERDIRAFVSGLTDADLERPLEYRLINGTPGVSTLAQMVPHVVNHASYHRGQVTTMLRQLGAPLEESVDLIAFHRERAASTW